MINGSVSGDVATKTVMEAAKAVAGENFCFEHQVTKLYVDLSALAKAAEGNLEASDIVEEVQARLQVFFLSPLSINTSDRTSKPSKQP